MSKMSLTSRPISKDRFGGGCSPSATSFLFTPKTKPIHRTSQNNVVVLNDSYKCRSVQKVRPGTESPFGFFFCVCACSRMSHLSISQRSSPLRPAPHLTVRQKPRRETASPFSLFPLFPSPISNRQPLLKDSCVWTLGH